MSSDKTPIRVRGKRSGTKPEKWNAGKLRHRLRKAPRSLELPTVYSPGVHEVPRSSKRRKVDLSNLEALPNEMIQAIFVHSGNLDLPSTSSNLNDRLSGKQLQWELTSNCLALVIMYKEDNRATAEALASATRLLNSRFMTWDFFRSWLDFQSETRALVLETDASAEERPPSRYADIWRALCPSPQLLPPSKVLHGPWSSDRVAFLEVFSSHATGNAPVLDGIAAEIAYEGLIQAVEQQSLDVIKLLRKLQVQPDQDILRKAVIDLDCDKSIVLYLLQWFVVDMVRWNTSAADRSDSRPRPDVDFLDPPLWNWAEKAKILGEPKGQWLTDLLKELSNTAASEDTRELRRLERDDSLYITQWQ